MFRLIKLFIKEGMYSPVGVGQSARGEKIKVIRQVSPEEIKEGDEVYVGTGFVEFIKTSPVKTIDKVSNSLYTIKTQTSTYHLEVYEEL